MADKLYSIVDYDRRYMPLDKSGRILQKADYVKVPINPKGDGLQKLLKYKRGREVFTIWILLLEKTTDQEPEFRGKLLNHKDEPASIQEIADGISHSTQPRFVEYALSVLVEMGWVECDIMSPDVPALEGHDVPPLRARAPDNLKSRVEELKSSEEKRHDVSKNKYREFVFLTDEEYKQLIESYGQKTINDYIDKLNFYIGSKGRKYKSHYYTILTWLRKENIYPKKKVEEGEQAALERKREQIRNDDGDHYRACSIEELRAMLKNKKDITRHWLIKEIIEEKCKEKSCTK